MQTEKKKFSIIEYAVLRPTDWRSYCVVVLACCAVLKTIGLFIAYEHTYLFSLALLPILISSVCCGIRFTLFCSFAMAIGVDYFFIHPNGVTFNNMTSFVRVFYFMAMGAFMGGLVGRLKELLSLSEKTKQQLIKSNAELDHTLSVVAHDIRLPAANITSLCTILNSGEVCPVQPALSKHTEMINKSGEQILSLVQDLVSHASYSKGKLTFKKETIHLQDCLTDLISINMLNANRKGIALSLKLPANALYICGDKKRLEQAISNLISNAVKFSMPQTEITVIAEQVENRVCVSIQDQGPGIPYWDLPKLFIPFERLSNKPTGGESSTSLGLSIVKSILDAHSAKINVSSELLKGTCFTLEFDSAPAVTESATNHTSRDEAPTAFAAKSPTILLADDDHISRLVTSRMLTKLGYQVLETEGGLSAVRILKEKNIDLILMDCEMPGMDGMEASTVIRRFTDKKGSVPIVGLTAHSSEKILEKCLQSGMNTILTKPVKYEDLKQTIQKSLDSDLLLQAS